MGGFKRILLSAAASAIALTVSGGAFAQTAPAPGTRVIQVPQGAVVLVLQPGGMPALPFFGPASEPGGPIPVMADPVAIIRRMDQQMDQMMAQTRAAFDVQDRVIEAAMNGMPIASPGVRSVVVTSFSNGRGTCTRRVIYGGDGAAPKVEISATGDASCGPGGMMRGEPTPAAAPLPATPLPAIPAPTRVWRVDNSVPKAGPQKLVVAQAGD